MESKRGQMQISFGMIFSIILIVAFLVFAFYGITQFLSMKDNIQIKQFEENLKLEIERMWKSGYGNKFLEYSLPKKYTRICFREPNILEINSDKRRERIELEHILIEGEDERNSLCIIPVNNKFNFTLTKTYGEPLVKVVR